MITLAPDHFAFLEAIRANPYDLSTRYIFADWLEEHGEENEAFLWRANPTFPLTKRRIEILKVDLKAINRKRRERILTLNDCIYCAHMALEKGWYACGGGTVANTYGYRAYQTVCFAARRSDRWVRIQADLQNATKGSSLTTPATGLPKNAKPEQFLAWANQDL